ncbi:MAG: DUF1501 domain-containing protein [Gemmataceae bacterium]
MRSLGRWDRREILRFGIGGMTTGLMGESLIGGIAADTAERPSQIKSVIYIFLSGGLSQIDSFDMKPEGPSASRGEFRPMSTRTPGIQICEHLPMLARQSHMWSLVRSMTHGSNEHSEGHVIMLTGKSRVPPGFSPNQPKPTDWPSIAAIVGQTLAPKGILPSALVLPEKLIHRTGRVIPGQFAGQMGAAHEPWFIEASPYRPRTYGAYPEYGFTMKPEQLTQDDSVFRAPNLSLQPGMPRSRLDRRLNLLEEMERLPGNTPRTHATNEFRRNRELATSLLSDRRVRWALDVTNAEIRTQERYGKNSFGWSLLMARRMVELGVRFVQVNLGNNETWDLHGSIFPRLKDALFPPTDRAVSALLDDLAQSGMLDQTLVVMAGEFGRTPRIFTLPRHYKKPGRDHWGAVQTVLLAGGGIQGGRVVGSSDRNGGRPASRPQTPENLAATMYEMLDIPKTAMWYDPLARPHHIYNGSPIEGLT